MTFGSRVTGLLLAALATGVLLAACSGGEAGEAGDIEAAENEARLILTDDGCTYAGDSGPTAGALTVEVENRSSVDGAFALGEMAANATIDDLGAYIEEERQRHEQGADLLGAPAFYSQVVRVGVAAGSSSRLPADLAAGTYALTCFNDDPPVWKAYLAAQLDVTD